jgi:hypothetical protein
VRIPGRDQRVKNGVVSNLWTNQPSVCRSTISRSLSVFNIGTRR